MELFRALTSSPFIYFVGTFCLVLVPLGSAQVYKRMPNGAGTFRGLEHGPKWQFDEYIKRQSAGQQKIYRWLTRLQIVCLVGMLMGIALFISAGFFSIYAVLFGWFIGALAWSFSWIFNGIGTLVIRGGSFPKELLVGTREFVLETKAVFAGLSRIAIGIFLLLVPLNALYSAYLLMNGQLGNLIISTPK